MRYWLWAIPSGETHTMRCPDCNNHTCDCVTDCVADSREAIETARRRRLKRGQVVTLTEGGLGMRVTIRDIDRKHNKALVERDDTLFHAYLGSLLA